jgi:uncharacterized repeat protein (TIGR03803 family)
MLIVLSFAGPAALHAQTFHVLHSFVNESEGFSPDGLTLGPDGALYGVASSGGKPASDCKVGCGTIYRLSREGTGWRFTVLHTFQDEPDGAVPYAPMIPGPDGSFYGATAGGGVYGCNHSGCGTIFKLQRPANCKTPSCGWTESVLYSFPGGNDGFEPGFDAPLTFDKEGNIYGTTEFGGRGASNEYGCGVVFELSPGVAPLFTTTR